MPSGYVRVWEPSHPLANRDGYVLEHRKVVHDAGVVIPPGTNVHHRNGIKDDNRLENLVVKPASTHHRDHVRAADAVVNQFGTHRLRSAQPCEGCGNLFVPWKKDGRFCSRGCANRR